MWSGNYFINGFEMKLVKSFIFLFVMLSSPTWANTLDITITGGTEGSSPIAVIPSAWTGTGAQPQYNINEIIAMDLQRSGRFRALEQRDMLSRPHKKEQVEFRDWRALGMDHLVIGEMTGNGPDRYSVNFVLFDVYRGEALLSYETSFNSRNLRSVAHQLADMIYEKLTGEPGSFDTKVAYVTATGSGDSKRTSLQIADSDGYNPQTIVASPDPLMSPAWSPDGRQIAYVSFEKGQPSIYIQEITSGKRRKIAGYPGINGAPAWSPDGRKLAMTLSKDGNPDIFIYDLGSGALDKFTSHYAIDTEPAWTPDGRGLIFTSDRGGKQQIYQAQLGAGDSPKRLTFEGQSNARGSFSPDGKLLVLETQTGSGYGIAIQDLASGRLKLLTNGGYDESPSFSPNGRMIIYATKINGRDELAAVSVDGRVKQRLQLQAGEVREPRWGPKKH